MFIHLQIPVQVMTWNNVVFQNSELQKMKRNQLIQEKVLNPSGIVWWDEYTVIVNMNEECSHIANILSVITCKLDIPRFI